nr:MAG TPA: hypothetical protein [Caudoviricetes sp.]
MWAKYGSGDVGVGFGFRNTTGQYVGWADSWEMGTF